MNILVSWSGGKYSAWVIHVLRLRTGVGFGALLTTFNDPARRAGLCGGWGGVLRAQAESLGYRLWMVPIPSPCPNDVYEAAMRTTVARAISEGFTHAAFGDLFLADIRKYREERLAGSGLTPLFPLFGTDADTPA